MGLLGLIGLVGLMGCNKASDNTYDNDGDGDGTTTTTQHAIGFSASLANEGGSAAASRENRTTRTAGDGELTTELLKGQGFGVYCWYTGTHTFTTAYDPVYINPNTGVTGPAYLLMQNQKVEWTVDASYLEGGYWTYSPSKYWPLNNAEMLTFRAYAPYVSYNLQTDANGIPLLPVVVKADDYHNGTQQDPLWGTGKLVNPSTNEYYHPGLDDPVGVAEAESKRYGTLYNNITYKMSGNQRMSYDVRDGYIDWYFHHGMASLMFACAIIKDPGCDKVTIKSISITPLYNQGLLSLNSETTQSTDKPTWSGQDGGITVTLEGATKGGDEWTAGDLTTSPGDPEALGYERYPFVIPATPLDETDATRTPYYNLLSTGLLIIPRNYSSTPMTITIKYTIDNDKDELTATGTLDDNFQGNTSYRVGLVLTPDTKGVEVNVVWAAFKPWISAGANNHTVYNW